MKPSRAILGLSFSIVVTLALTGCNQESSASRPATPVRTAEVQVIRTGNEVQYSANVIPNAQVDLAFRSGGYVDSIRQVRGNDGRSRPVDEGDWVTKGTVLAVVHEQDYNDKLQQAKAQLARAQADAEHAKLQFDRVNALYSTQSATKPDYDQAKAQNDSSAAAVSAAQAAVGEAQLALGYCSLRVPFDGWIIKRNVDVGSLVGPASTGFVLADTRSVKAVFGVPDVRMGRVSLGQKQSITTDALPGEFEGRITAISPAADPKSRVYSVEVTIPNAREHLKSGMIATIAIEGKKLSEPVTAIPLSAVIRDPQKSGGFAVLVTEGGSDTTTVRSRTVDLGDAYGNLIAVTSGLKAGERVVTSGATLVKSGDQVRIIP